MSSVSTLTPEPLTPEPKQGAEVERLTLDTGGKHDASEPQPQPSPSRSRSPYLYDKDPLASG